MEDKDNFPVNNTGVNSPAIDPDTMKVQQRAIKDGDQAWTVFTSLFKNNDNRTRTNAEIVSLYTGKQPKDPKELKASGRDWESNFPTLFLAGIVDRVVPTLVNAIDEARFLTQSKLVEQQGKMDVAKKSAIFQERLTQKIRQWKEWRNFVYSLCQEIILIGYAFVLWTDEDTPYPMFVRQDKLALPEGTPQYSSGVQLFALKQPMLIHEFVDTIKKKGAKDAGWDMENCVKSANEAMPINPSSSNQDEQRSFADIVREGNPGASFSEGTKVVQLGHLFAIEPESQKVSHFILDSEHSGRVLFEREDRFESMDDVIKIFTLEPGNGKAYGSKGLGRMLSNFSIGVDAATNDAVDQVRTGGMIICKTDSKGAVNAQIKVRKPFIIINDDMKLEQEKLEASPEAFVALYSQLAKMAEVAAGAYIPNLLSNEAGGRDKTAREATIDYTREVQAKTAFVIRFRGQVGDVMSQIQKRFLNTDTTDEDAKEFQKELKDEHGFTTEDFKELREAPAAELAQDLSSVEAQQKVAVYDKFLGNPNVDQIKTLDGAISGMTNADYARDIILPTGIDPTIEVENVRQQIGENTDIMNGESVPISPRDNDAVHLKVLIQELQQAAPEIVKNFQALHDQPELLDHINAAMIHGEAHVQQMLTKGAPPESVAQYEDFFNQVDKSLKAAAKKLMEEKQQMAEQKAQETHQMHVKAAEEHILQISDPNAPPPEGAEPQPPPLTEKILVAWIGQYQNLRGAERTRLEQRSGLGAAPGEPMLPDSPPLSQTKEENITVEHPDGHSSTTTHVTKGAPHPSEEMMPPPMGPPPLPPNIPPPSGPPSTMGVPLDRTDLTVGGAPLP